MLPIFSLSSLGYIAVGIVFQLLFYGNSTLHHMTILTLAHILIWPLFLALHAIFWFIVIAAVVIPCAVIVHMVRSRTNGAPKKSADDWN